ncbi:ferric reduction oxidase 2-like [Olea europaea var. sylvestris]|uniref:ferric reduction oxidase 2-like n=1 Tax=Olea europaea var. sylvestris TaxID=158386 RepID=UPI000C1D1FA7|nr:ferric reduction oxidase 2-like [Olea europaea var. sylvestris]
MYSGYIGCLIYMLKPTRRTSDNKKGRIYQISNKYSCLIIFAGANILIYSFPVLFVAALGCLYLQLEKYIDRSKDETPKESRFASWRRPALVNGPLGIVSWIELSFLVMFLALLVWSFSAYVHSMFKNITRQSAGNMGEFVWEAKLESAALLLGLVGNISLAFLFFPVTRGSSILRVLGLSSESTIKYHIWLGHIVMILFASHGLCYIIFWAYTNQTSEMWAWNKFGVSNVAGEVALLSGLVIWMTSFPRIRRKFFELFYYTHHLYAVFVVFFVLHAGFSYSCISLPGFYIFLIDRYLRFLQSQQRIHLVSTRVLPCQAVELNFSKDPGLRYDPGSIMFINVKSISKIQWHPFTVTSNCNIDPDKISIVIKSEGNWSQNLYKRLASSTPVDRLEVSIEGPYGPPSTSYLRHDELVMISGGSGITPFISIIRELIFIANTTNCKTPRILLIPAFKKTEDLAMLEFFLPISGTSYDISLLQLQIQAYVTREKGPSPDSQKLDRSIWFKPSTLDRPVSAVLGPNTWLWLGVIIASTFVLFLFLIGILTKYYIYPIDHNTNIIYPYYAKSMIYMSLLCMSMVIIATLAFFWNKKRNSKELRQIQNADAPTPTVSPRPELWSSNVDRELEGLPHYSFSRVTTVHHGERPNLKNILMERKESNVGVLVSGPKKMSQEVAKICSSRAAKHMHYKSFSFDW